MTGTDRIGTDWLTAASAERGKLLLMIMALSGCVGLLYADTFASMVGIWEASSTFAHGFFILPASAFVIWRKRRALRPGAVGPSFAGFSLLAVAVILWFLSSNGNAQVGQHFAFVAIVGTAIWAVLGTENVRAIRFPLLFAFFAVPFGESLIPPLMSWTAEFAVWALNATGIPVYLEAYAFSLPSGNFEVIEACSGIRYLIVTVILATFFAHERFASLKRRSLFVLGAAAAIILANGIRAYLAVLIVHLSGREFGTGSEHIYLGWAVFVIFIVIILAIGSRFSDHPSSEPVASPEQVDGGDGAGERFPGSAFVSMFAAIAIIALGPLGQRIAHLSSSNDLPLTTLPRGAGPWSGPGTSLLAYRPMFGGDYQAVHGSYVSGLGAVDVHGILFMEQVQGNELVNYGNRLFDHTQWRMVERTNTRPVSLEGKSIKVNHLVIGDGRQNVVLWYWYDIGGWGTTSEMAAKFYHGLQAVMGRNTGDAVVVLATPVSPSDESHASARLEAFLSAHIDALSLCLRASRESEEDCRLQAMPDTDVE